MNRKPATKRQPNPPKHHFPSKSNQNSIPLEIKSLNIYYQHLKEQIWGSQFFVQTNQHNKIRLIRWFQKLDLNIREASWLKNRNKYAELLYLMSMCGVLLEPFSSFPVEGELPQLKNYEIHEIIDGVERHVNEQASRYGSCVLCQLEKKKGASSSQRCSTKYSFCSTKKDSFRDHNAKCNMGGSDSSGMLGGQQQVEEESRESSFGNDARRRESFGEWLNKENQCSNTLLAKNITYKQSMREKMRHLKPAFTQDEQKFSCHQTEENVSVKRVRKCCYFSQRRSKAHLNTFGSDCDEQSLQKTSIIEHINQISQEIAEDEQK